MLGLGRRSAWKEGEECVAALVDELAVRPQSLRFQPQAFLVELSGPRHVDDGQHRGDPPSPEHDSSFFAPALRLASRLARIPPAIVSVHGIRVDQLTARAALTSSIIASRTCSGVE